MSLAAFRKSPQHDDLAKLAEEHLKHDLQPSDREVLQNAAGTVSIRATVGTIVGLGLGIYAAFRLRKVRMDVFQAFRTSEKPTHVMFAGGRTGKCSCTLGVLKGLQVLLTISPEAVPDITPYMQPTRYGDIATYFFFGLGGTFLGGELGFILGTWSAARTIAKDPERKRRIETAYRRFKADYLRNEAKKLEEGGPVFP
jgi:hypothetical protein